MHMKSEGGEIGVYLCPENDDIDGKLYQQSYVKSEADLQNDAAGSPSNFVALRADPELGILMIILNNCSHYYG